MAAIWKTKRTYNLPTALVSFVAECARQEHMSQDAVVARALAEEQRLAIEREHAMAWAKSEADAGYISEIAEISAGFGADGVWG